MLGKERIKVRSWHDRPIKSSRAAQARQEAKASRLLMSCQIPEQQRKLSEPPLTVESWTKDVAKNQSVCLYKLIITRKRWSLTFSSPFILRRVALAGRGVGGNALPYRLRFHSKKATAAQRHPGTSGAPENPRQGRGDPHVQSRPLAQE